MLIPLVQVEGGGYNQGYYIQGCLSKEEEVLEAYEALRECEDCTCRSNTCDDLVEWIISLFLKASAFTIKSFPRPY